MRRALSPVITVVALALRPASGEGLPCAGDLSVSGDPNASITIAGYSHNNVPTVSGSSVKVPLSSRSYVSDACAPGEFAHESYAAWALLGKSLSFTLDMSAGAGCGCNFAVYLTAMHQNEDPGSEGCGYDYYCDAAYVCGPTACTELDIAEGNQYAWHSTLHVANDEAVDTSGSPKGLGGGFNDFTSEQYGLGGSHVDTSKPFDVTAEFPKDASSGELSSITIKLEQAGGEGPLTMTWNSYSYWNKQGQKKDDGLAQLTAPLAAGLTPVISCMSLSDISSHESSATYFSSRARAPPPRRLELWGRRLGQHAVARRQRRAVRDGRPEQLHDRHGRRELYSRRSLTLTRAHNFPAGQPAGRPWKGYGSSKLNFKVGQCSLCFAGETTGRGRALELCDGVPTVHFRGGQYTGSKLHTKRWVGSTA